MKRVRTPSSLVRERERGEIERVRERKREGERERKREGGREREKEGGREREKEGVRIVQNCYFLKE